MKKKGEKEMVQETKFRIQFVFVRELNECQGSGEWASKQAMERGGALIVCLVGKLSMSHWSKMISYSCIQNFIHVWFDKNFFWYLTV